MGEPSFLRRLKERKLVQWALAYLAGAFVVFQLLDALEGPLGLTVPVQRAVLAVVGIGFFLTLVLAWYHGEKGRQRVSGPELMMIAILLVIAGMGLSLLRGREEVLEPTETASPAVGEDGRPALAVLPFANLSGDPDNEYFSDGITGDIINHLSRIGDLKVISRTSVMQYKGTTRLVREIGDELGVTTVLEGEVQRIGDRVRINAQLIDAETGPRP
jgi:TolB-like protein